MRQRQVSWPHASSDSLNGAIIPTAEVPDYVEHEATSSSETEFERLSLEDQLILIDVLWSAKIQCAWVCNMTANLLNVNINPGESETGDAHIDDGDK